MRQLIISAIVGVIVTVAVIGLIKNTASLYISLPLGLVAGIVVYSAYHLVK